MTQAIQPRSIRIDRRKTYPDRDGDGSCFKPMHFLRFKNRNMYNIAVSGKQGAQGGERIDFRLSCFPRSIRVKRLPGLRKMCRMKRLPRRKP